MSEPAPKKKESSEASDRRKREHIDIVLNKDVAFRVKTSGFENIDFIHNALPELKYDDVDLSISFLDKRINAPLLISCMTGGFSKGESINRSLAEVCEEMNIPMGLGSQRQMLGEPERGKQFANVRDIAPDIPILANIGATEIAGLHRGQYKVADFIRLINTAGADALVVHCNPLQELMQPEGNTDFRGVYDGLSKLIKETEYPVIVKEVGAGISRGVADRLLAAGVRYIDVAGAGGTSWSGIEILRHRDGRSYPGFWDWGIPTYEALRSIVPLRTAYPSLRVIVSGGINDGITAAKAIAAGGDMAGSARIFLEELTSGGKKSLKQLISLWIEDMRRVMFLTGAGTISELQKVRLVTRIPSYEDK